MKINLKEHLSLTEKRNAKSDLLFSRKRNRRRCAAFRNTEKGLAFILPSFAGVCIFWLIPYVDVIRRSFCGAVNGEFVGIENYRTIFANKAFRLAAGNTLRFFGVCVPLLVVLSLIIAVLLAGQKRFTQILKSFFLLPMAIPVASVVLLWRLLFDDQGLLNHLLHMLSVQTTDWMNTGASFYVLVISYIWRNLGYDVVLWMAGLSAIPAALYEAAKVDGAGEWKCFTKITLPNLLPSLFTIVVLSVLNAFKVFREAYLVAGDYPQEKMYLLQHLFNNWYRDLSLDKMSAAAVVTGLVIFLLILGLWKAWGRMRKVMQIFRIRKIGSLLLVLLALVAVFPVFFSVTGSLMGQKELNDLLGAVLTADSGSASGQAVSYVFWRVLPLYPTLRSYVKVLLDSPEFFVMFWNSVKITVGVLAGQILVGVPAAWGFARYRFPGKNLLFMIYVALMMMPFQVMMLSNYLVLDQMKLLDHLWGIILPAAFSTFPVFIMYRFFESIPEALMESARLDGAGELLIFIRIGIPLGSAGIISALVLGFLEYWNLIEQPMAFLKTKSLWPLSLYLPQIDISQTGKAFAVSVLVLIPAVIVFLAGQDYLEQGIISTAIKE